MTDLETRQPSVTLKLTSKDGQSFLVEKNVATQMKFIDDMLSDVDVADGREIPMGDVEAIILSKVIDFCEFHHKHPLDRDTIEEIDQWEKEFVKVDKSVLFRLILAANFLNIQPLLDLCCRTVADMIKGKTPEEIRAEFAIDEEFAHLAQ